MTEHTTDLPPHALSCAECMQIVAVEPILNRLAGQGLQVRPLPSGAWCWEWHGHTGVAPDWGSAITAAICWYIGLAPAASDAPPAASARREAEGGVE